MSASNQGCVGSWDMLSDERFEELFGGPEVTFLPPALFGEELNEAADNGCEADAFVTLDGFGVWDVFSLRDEGL